MRPFTVSNLTKASAPGNVGLDPLVWTKHNLRDVIPLTAGVLLAVLLCFFSLWFFPVLLVALYKNGFYWLRKKEHFAMGCSNAGIVISLDPCLVAVSTGLGKYGAQTNYPVVKVIPYTQGEDVALGKRIGTVALYSGRVDDIELMHWIDFYPIPVEYATRNKEQLLRVLESYPDEDWTDLERRIMQLDRPYRPGIYKVDLYESDWKESEYKF